MNLLLLLSAFLAGLTGLGGAERAAASPQQQIERQAERAVEALVSRKALAPARIQSPSVEIVPVRRLQFAWQVPQQLRDLRAMIRGERNLN